ncbi:MAG: hypothetical protein ABWY00_12270, partial [Dongiaceae bacterium]
FDTADADRVTDSQRDFTLAYLARVVTPGKYKVPAVTIEDMYKPEFRAQGDTGKMVITAP